MNAELNETNLVGKKNVKIIVDFNHYIENGEIKELEDSITREFTVKFTSTTGELDVEERNTTDQVTYAVYSAVIGENNITINSAKSEVELTFITSEPLEDHISIEMDDKDKLVGFARVISDYATTYYLSDVIIDMEYQHKGLGTALISYINSLPEFSGLRGVLITRDAQALYRKFGFEVMNDRAMVKEPNR